MVDMEGRDYYHPESLAQVLHDFRLPLSVIRGYVDLMEEQEPGAQGEFLRHIRRNVDHLNMMVEDLMDLASIQGGRYKIESRAFDLAAELSAILRPLAAAAERKGLKLDLVLKPPLPESIHGDPLRLSQIIGNLVANALRFTEEGAITVTVQTLIYESGAQMLAVDISDPGTGIEPHHFERVFQNFHTIGPAHATRERNLGVGLTLARQLASNLGGSLELLRSTPGLETTFRLILKLNHAAPEGLQVEI